MAFTAEQKKTYLHLIEQTAKTYEAAGIAVALVGKSEVYDEIFYGYRDSTNKLPIDQDTLFGLASVTKSFTCLAVLCLASEGKVDLDAPVSRYIPDFTGKNRKKPVLVRHLMSHTGSFWPVRRKVVEPLAKEMQLWDMGIDLAHHVDFEKEAVRRVAKDLDAQTPPLGEPGEYFSYSNDSFGLLADIIRTRGSEKTYADYLSKHILAPLGLSSRSSCDFLAPQNDPNAAVLYEKRDGQMVATRNYYDEAFVMMSGGAMKATPRDMQKVLQMYLRGGEPVLPREMYKKMTTPYASYRHNADYGFGLSVSNIEGHTVWGHGGSLTGVSSAILFCEEKGVGVVVLCNTSGVPSTMLAEAAMRGLLGFSPEPVQPVAAKPWSTQTMQKAAGLYRSQEGSEIEIRFENGEISVLSAEKPMEFLFYDERTVLLKSKMTWSDLTLFCEESGTVFAVRYGGRMLKRQ